MEVCVEQHEQSRDIFDTQVTPRAVFLPSCTVHICVIGDWYSMEEAQVSGASGTRMGTDTS